MFFVSANKRDSVTTLTVSDFESLDERNKILWQFEWRLWLLIKNDAKMSQTHNGHDDCVRTTLQRFYAQSFRYVYWFLMFYASTSGGANHFFVFLNLWYLHVKNNFEHILFLVFLLTHESGITKNTLKILLCKLYCDSCFGVILINS